MFRYRYICWDVETSYNEHFKRRGNPFVECTKLVCVAYKTDEMKEPVVARAKLPKQLFQAKTWIGFNIKYDILHVMRYAPERVIKWIRDGGKVWDCQLVESMIHGRLKLGYSLDKTALRHGGTIKDDRIKLLWESGVATEDIPADLLDEYVIGDVNNTYLIAKRQARIVKELGMLPIVEEHCKNVLLTMLCEYNGVKVDLKAAEELRESLKKEEAEISEKLKEQIIQLVGANDYEHINIQSVDCMSALLYGGEIKVRRKVPVITETGDPYIFKGGAKKGQIKEVYKDIPLAIKGFGLKKKEELKAKKEGNYSTAFKVLLENSNKIKFIETLLAYRKISKLSSTYVSEVGGSVCALVHPDGLVHGSFNHCVTSTGRLSGSAPNMQNLDKHSALRRIFVSRFANGKIISFDWSQLEMRTMAFHTQDDQLIADIYDNVDGYIKTLAQVEGVDYEYAYNKAKVECDPVWKEKRSLLKAATLGLNYGMGAIKAAAHLNIDLDFVKDIIKARNLTYPQLELFSSRLHEIIKSNLVSEVAGCAYEMTTAKGLSANVGMWTDPFKARFMITEEDAPDFMVEKGIFKGFSPPKIKNYPNQSMASHINAIGTNLLMDKILPYWPNILVQAVIHDDVKFDCHPDYVDLCIQFLKELQVELPNYLSKRFNVSFNVPLAGEISLGPSWGELEEYKE